MSVDPPTTYMEKKLAERCTYGRCSRPLAPDSQLCDRHLRKQRKRDASSKQKARAANRAAGLCAFCPIKSKAYRCKACYAKHRGGKALGVRSGVDTKQARIAALTKTHADGRTRYHGQGKRGGQPPAQLDDQDFASAAKLLNAGMARLDLYRSAEVQAMPRIQRESIRRQATQELDLGMRFFEDIQERNGHFRQRHGRRDGE